MTIRASGARRSRSLLAAVALIAVAGCSTTQRVKVKEPGQCVFLRPIVCQKLAPGGGKLADMRYVNPGVQWSRYDKVMVMPISFWGGDKDKLPASDRQALADYFHATLVAHLGQKFEVVEQPSPGAMKLQIAITDASAATPVLRTISMVVPQARALNTLKYLATGTYSFVGSTQGEAELSDSTTGQVLAAVMDRRVGGGSIETAAQWKWGDARNAMDAWAKQLTDRLAAWTAGAATP